MEARLITDREMKSFHLGNEHVLKKAVSVINRMKTFMIKINIMWFNMSLTVE